MTKHHKEHQNAFMKKVDTHFNKWVYLLVVFMLVSLATLILFYQARVEVANGGYIKLTETLEDLGGPDIKKLNTYLILTLVTFICALNAVAFFVTRKATMVVRQGVFFVLAALLVSFGVLVLTENHKVGKDVEKESLGYDSIGKVFSGLTYGTGSAAVISALLVFWLYVAK